jgi:hypothetical protein
MLSYPRSPYFYSVAGLLESPDKYSVLIGVRDAKNLFLLL